MATGNYGGASIPTQNILTTVLAAGSATTYSAWTCTGLYSIADDKTVQVRGVNITLNEGQSIDISFNPDELSVQDASVAALCYDCTCNTYMTTNRGFTTNLGPAAGAIPSNWPFSSNTSQFFMPSIIGGGHSNN
jgi:hypothetical protein|tara:strand:- start:1286 stop:1687 length:402 start_codon:yes stop_codon:yes gene_type:complete